MFLTHLQKKLGITEREAPRVRISWTNRLLWYIGFVVSWTIITALFVEHFGIANLVWLFLGEGVMIAAGSVLSSTLLERLDLERFLLLMIGGSLTMLGLAFLFPPHSLAFFGFLIVAKDIFFTQLSIGLYRHQESFFSPTQATRIVPMIDSAITIGSIVGAGLVVASLKYIAPEMVLFWWAGALVTTAAIIMLTPQLLHDIPHFHEEQTKHPSFSPLKEGFHALKSIPFLGSLVLLLIAQGLVFTVIEFQFTKDVQSHISHQYEHQIHTDDLQISILHDAVEKVEHAAAVVSESAHEISTQLIMHETLAHDLGMFHLLFGLVALFVQFLVAPQILGRFGVVRAMGTYVGIVLLAVLGMIGGAININLLRMIQHGSHAIGESGYHLQFYSIFSHGRESIRLVLEGLIRPLGVALGVLVLVVLPEEQALWAAALVLGGILLGLPQMKSALTKLSCENLDVDQDIEEKLRAIEVLAQPGHTDSVITLSQELLHDDLHPIIRQKVLHSLTDIQDPRVVHTYIQLLRDPIQSDETKIQVLDSLAHIDITESFWSRHAFARQSLLETLSNLFEKENNQHLKKLVVMNFFRHLPAHEIVPFFRSIMKKEDEHLQSICLRSCTIFEDPSLAMFVQQYLDHTSPRMRGYAVIALWQWEDKTKLTDILLEMIASNDESSIIAALYAIGETGHHDMRDLVLEFTHDTNAKIQLHALIALGKMGEKSCVPGLLNILLGRDKVMAQSAYWMLDRVGQKDNEILELIKREVQLEVSRQVNAILRPRRVRHRSDLERLSNHIIEELRRLYRLAEQYDDLLVLERV